MLQIEIIIFQTNKKKIASWAMHHACQSMGLGPSQSDILVEKSFYGLCINVK
jgi:hypothetical protein